MDTRELVKKILEQNDRASKLMLFGYYKSRLSEEQVAFVNRKLGLGGWDIDKANELIIAAEDMGFKRV